MKAGYLLCSATIKANATPFCHREALQFLPASFESTREFLDFEASLAAQAVPSARDVTVAHRSAIFVAVAPPEHKPMKLHLLA
jgi:hypothetical protein